MNEDNLPLTVINEHYLTCTLSLLQRKLWLKNALAEVSKGQMDEVEKIKQCLAVLSQVGTSETAGEGEDEKDGDDRETAFEILSELCENLDNARGL